MAAPIGLRPTTPLEEVLPEGTDPPTDIPAPVFAAALSTILSGERLDVQALAAEVGLSRSTLYRRVGSRDHLIGGVVWYLTRRVLASALAESASLAGAQRISWMFWRVLDVIAGQPAFQRMLADEPQTALRVLTSKDGCVQPAFVEFTRRVLVLEQERSGFVPPIPPPILAFVIVRIGEGFLYADLIAGGTADVPAAVETIALLLGSCDAPCHAGRAALARQIVRRGSAVASGADGTDGGSVPAR
jgi:AcrR family transcriptional regulator